MAGSSVHVSRTGVHGPENIMMRNRGRPLTAWPAGVSVQSRLGPVGLAGRGRPESSAGRHYSARFTSKRRGSSTKRSRVESLEK